MDVITALTERRAVKHFDPEYKIPAEVQHKIFNAVFLSPSAFNLQNYRLVQVDDPELRGQIRAAAWNQAQVTDASLLLVVCADINAWQKNPARYWSHAPQAVQDFMVPAITQYYQGRPDVQRDEAMRSAGLLAMSLMLTVKSMGYDSCPMDGFDFDAVGKLIHLPADHIVCLMVAVGKKIKDAWPRGPRLDQKETIIHNHF